MNTIRLMTLLVLVLFTIYANAQTKRKFYYPKLSPGSADMDRIKADISKHLTNGIWVDDQKNLLKDKPKGVLVLDDRIEFKLKNQNTIFYFSDLPLDYNINVHEGFTVKNENGSVSITWSSIWFGNFTFSCYSSEPIMKLADDFFFIQYHLNEKRFSLQLILFEPIAAQYLALKVKPTVSEETRECIVQANSFNQQKIYHKAIELYLKAIELNQTAYPAAYSNLALLSAQVHRFDAAIYYMKKYLMLEPEASDARGAQDKIYEWKAQLSN